MKPKTAKQLHDAISACDELETYTADWTREEFLLTRSLQLIVWKLVDIVGEALERAEESHPSLKYQIPEIDDVVHAMDRSTVSHGAVDFAQLWDIVENETPALRQKLAAAKSRAMPAFA